jgi:hypothetical protein
MRKQLLLWPHTSDVSEVKRDVEKIFEDFPSPDSSTEIER